MSSGTGRAPMTTTWPRAPGSPTGWSRPRTASSRPAAMDGETYEQWVAGIDLDTGRRKGRVRDDANALRFVEVIVNGPKTWSLAAALHPEISDALDAAQDQAAAEIVGWVAQHATTRVGPRGRQVQVPVEQIEAAVIRHYTSRAGDPHRHLHLQINARVCGAPAGGAGCTRSGCGTSIEAINGIGHAAVATDPRVPGRPRRARVHPRPRDRRDRASSRRTSGRSAPGPRRSAATSTATRPSGGASIPARSPGRGCARRGIGGRGPRPGRTRSSPPTAPSWSHGGTTSCATSATATPHERRSRAGGRRRSGWIDRDGGRGLGDLPARGEDGRRGTPPTSAARSRSCSPRPAWSPTPRSGSSWPRTSPPAPPHAASDCSPRPTCPSTSGR